MVFLRSVPAVWLLVLAVSTFADDGHITLPSAQSLHLDETNPDIQKLMQTVASILPDRLTNDCTPSCECVSGRCDPITGTCICDPGYSGATCNNTILFFREISMHGNIPDPRAYSASGVYLNKFLIAGGVVQFDDIFTRTMDFYMFDIPSVTWTKFPLTEDHPNGRSDAAFFVYEDQLYIFGGYDVLGNYRNDLSAVSIGNGVWTTVHGDDSPANYSCNEAVHSPSRRARSAVALVGSEAFFWGGVYQDESNSRIFYQDFHAYNLIKNAWVNVPVNGPLVPPPRAGHTLTHVGNALYVFGGGTYNNEYLNDLHRFNLGE